MRVYGSRLADSCLVAVRVAGQPLDFPAMATNRALEDLRELGERVQAAELALDEARRRRDDAIREVRRSTDHTVPEIADAAGVSQATVKTVLRGVR
jgi:signal transduction histidine kinase